MQSFCSQCGTALAAGAKFCARCGARVPEAAGEAPQLAGIAGGAAAARTRAERPLAFVLVVLYTGVDAIMSIALGAPLLLVGGVPGVSTLVPLLGVASLIVGVLDLAACYGLWATQRWGRPLAVALYVMSIPLSLVSLPLGDVNAGTVLLSLATIAIAVVILKYLSSADIRRMFE